MTVSRLGRRMVAGRTIVLWALIAGIAGTLVARAKNDPRPALTGRVTSEAEGPMEGVLVTGKDVGSTVSVTVVTDHEGVYSFPAGRLSSRRYKLDVRAIGYDLAHPVFVDISDKTARAELKLVRTKNLPAQLTSAEWLLSVPGTEDQKSQLFRCAACHSLEPIVQSTYDDYSGPGIAGTMPTA
jgi:virginiamycin B lyase